MSRKKSNVKAAIAGSEEVSAELQGNMRAADRYGNAEKNDRRPGRDRRGGGKPSSGGMSRPSSGFHKLATQPLFPVTANPYPNLRRDVKKVKLADSGLEFTTYYTSDPFMTNKTEVVVLEYATINWGTFQIGTPLVVDTNAQNLGTRVTAQWQTICDVINWNGRFSPNQLLTVATHFPTYLNSYHAVFSILWTFLSLYEALDINTSTRLFGKGIGQAGNIAHAAELWRRLQLIPIPPGFVEHLSMITGVYYSDIEDMVILGYVNSAAVKAGNTDWQLATGALSVDVLLTFCETNMAGLEGGTNEAPIINEVLSIVYGVPSPLPKPYVHTDPVAFDVHFTCASTFHVATQFTAPSTNSQQGAGTVPVLIRTGWETSPYCNIMFSLLRPQIYDAGNLGSNATSSQVGLMIIPSTNALEDFSRYYGPTAGGTNHTLELADSAFTAPQLGGAGVNFFEVRWWELFTQTTSGIAAWFTDSRSFDRWSTFYPNVAAMYAQSTILVENMFYKGMKIRELR